MWPLWQVAVGVGCGCVKCKFLFLATTTTAATAARNGTHVTHIGKRIIISIIQMLPKTLHDSTASDKFQRKIVVAWPQKYRCEEMQKVLHAARRTVAVAATVDTL